MPSDLPTTNPQAPPPPPAMHHRAAEPQQPLGADEEMARVMAEARSDLADLPRSVVATFARWIGGGALAGAIALGIAGAWYLGMTGLIIGAVVGVIAGAIAGLMLLFWLNWPF